MATYSQVALPEFIALSDYTDMVQRLGVDPAAIHEIRLLPGEAQVVVFETRKDGSKNRLKKRTVTIPVR